MENNDVIKRLNDTNNWRVANGSVNFYLESEDADKIKQIADENLNLRKFFEFSTGHLALKDIKKLSNEIKIIKEKYPKLDGEILSIMNQIISREEFYEDKIQKNDIDSYMMSGGDLWFFPGGIMNMIHLYALKNAINLPLSGEKLYDFLGSIESRYKTLTELKVIPKFNEAEILDYSKRLVVEDWDSRVAKNTDIVENLLEIDFNFIKKEIDLEEYEGKYKIYYIYKKYTPSKEVISKVKKHAQDYLDEKYLKELEIVFLPTGYKGYKDMRKLFKGKQYKFKEKEIHIIFE